MAKYQWIASYETGASPALLTAKIQGALSNWEVISNAGALGGKTIRLKTGMTELRRRLVLPGVSAPSTERLDIRGRFFRAGPFDEPSMHFFVALGTDEGSGTHTSYFGQITVTPNMRIGRFTPSSTTTATTAAPNYSGGEWVNFRYTYSPTNPRHELRMWTDAAGYGGATFVTSNAIGSNLGDLVGFGVHDLPCLDEMNWITVGTNGDDADVTPAADIPVSFVGSIANPEVEQGEPASLPFASYFSGAAVPFVYSVHAGTLPPGLSLNTTTGVISGTPTTLGTYSGIVIRATDDDGATADSNSFSIIVKVGHIVVRGVLLKLHNGVTPLEDLDGLRAAWFDQPDVALLEAPTQVEDDGATDGDGDFMMDIDDSTTLGVGDYGFLVITKPGGGPEEDLVFAGRIQVKDIG